MNPFVLAAALFVVDGHADTPQFLLDLGTDLTRAGDQMVDLPKARQGGLGGEFFSIWVDPELASLQRNLEEKFPGRSVIILQWNERRTRFLVQVTGGSDLGRVYAYERADDLLVELMRRAPWLGAAELHESKFISFDGPGGSLLTGYLTLPRAPRINPPPLIIGFASGIPPSRCARPGSRSRSRASR